MGRTNPTFRDVLRGIRERWKPFRRGLRREDQAVFDDLLAKAGAHADAAGYANPTDPVTLVLLSILLEQQAEIAALTERLDVAETRARLGGTETEARLAGLEARLDDLEATLDHPHAGDHPYGGDYPWTDDRPRTDDHLRPAIDLLPDGGDGERADSGSASSWGVTDHDSINRETTDPDSTDCGTDDPGGPSAETIETAIDAFWR